MKMTLGIFERAALEGVGCLAFLALVVVAAVLFGWCALEWASR